MKFILIAGALIFFSTESLSATEIGCSQIKSNSSASMELSRLVGREKNSAVEKTISVDGLDDSFCHTSDEYFAVAQLYYYGNFLEQNMHKAISNLELAIAKE
ncbi:hypothetical protein OAP14_07040, partial [Aliiglaciecola sp.]|nr:hypothetical protein [Aliiglaciecola sp.]